MPAYVVLHDATLRDLAAARPASLHELAAVKGFGPTKIERYGDDVLALVAASLELETCRRLPLRAGGPAPSEIHARRGGRMRGPNRVPISLCGFPSPLAI